MSCLRVDAAEWREELPSIREHFDSFGEQLPPALLDAACGARGRPGWTLSLVAPAG